MRRPVRHRSARAIGHSATEGADHRGTDRSAEDDPLGLYRPESPAASRRPDGSPGSEPELELEPGLPVASLTAGAPGTAPAGPTAGTRAAATSRVAETTRAGASPAATAAGTPAPSPAGPLGDGLGQVRKDVEVVRARSRGLGLRGHEVIAGAGASALATLVTSTLGIGGTAFGSAMTSIVIAIAGAVFAKLLTRDRSRGTGAGTTARSDRSDRSAPAARRGRGGVFLRTVGVALAVTLGTGVIGAIILTNEMGGSVSQQLINITSSGYRAREMWDQAWPYLKEAWRAAVR
ncbi:hypothetical protein [Acidipropionibacterium jensenii]|uniref:hypothetical protein n=1 Tax=Acidipropionibacterium jensenii TaxID=1749 RepID=UPI0013785BFB|nr:hypothetical protein [Acidipropionibacterium jensenii]MDN6426836.1 hypothetical protein [Acidipropionibacterium jensenii]MDN6441565.1 hypothetical protein [Acidipropionibacterium jensenii]MDN6623835.1 hypothetical protein [Acidipropionibacterium jensenii]MDN6811795.1 hypothetical protein [Acidipropionibacterium jensenii]